MRKIIGVTSKFTTASLYACSTSFQHNSSCRLRVDEKPKLPVHRRNRIRVDRAEALGAHVGDACVRVCVRSAASTREWAFKDHGQNSTTKWVQLRLFKLQCMVHTTLCSCKFRLACRRYDTSTTTSIRLTTFISATWFVQHILVVAFFKFPNWLEFFAWCKQFWPWIHSSNLRRYRRQLQLWRLICRSRRLSKALVL